MTTRPVQPVPAPVTKSSRLHEWLSVIALLLLVTGWRFYQVRHLVLPAWVDSVHHTLLVRILLEHRRLAG